MGARPLSRRRHCRRRRQRPEVEALGGEPGVHSARFAGEGHDSRANNALLIERLSGIDNRRARFRTVVALLRRGAEPIFFEGTVEGTITQAPGAPTASATTPISFLTASRAPSPSSNPKRKTPSATAVALWRLCVTF